ncbi:hypothetical protein CAPTEDRAFT_201378 [Capitella teleta]|uniref:Uncharacterized protein n=1 Tax=Capitella teleta TaxID=283909 RepID=R7THG5_CAPTE|nr:hypothetical protein CAPTEDRAFT_201378 [Capitella teleta]|eukprot:ELT93159.1 hypothetical protein CAPTEDRAFT_201378 [Capitella teleta]
MAKLTREWIKSIIDLQTQTLTESLSSELAKCHNEISKLNAEITDLKQKLDSASVGGLSYANAVGRSQTYPTFATNYLKEASPITNKPACQPSEDAGHCQTS